MDREFVPKSGESMAGKLAVLMMPIMPALDKIREVSRDQKPDAKIIRCSVETDKMPMLMPMATPIFSIFRIVSFQIIVQGSRARMMSIAAE
jgi:hypothetical protein